MITRRREFLLAGATLGISGATGRMLLATETPPAAEDVSAVEDLMREHGVLRRLLLIYEEFLRRFRAKEDGVDIPRTALFESATLVQKFVEEYHEKLEESYLFPEFEKRSQLVSLVKVLREQHSAGRALTGVIVNVAASQAANKLTLRTPKLRQRVAESCEAFIRMYRPHAAREDTVLFPSFKKLLSPKQLDELGDKFEEEENRRFGAKGFEQTVEKVAAIEKELGIYDLSQFTPKKPQ
jgi:hemerythrin-like domain-containing protein